MKRDTTHACGERTCYDADNEVRGQDDMKETIGTIKPVDKKCSACSTRSFYVSILMMSPCEAVTFQYTPDNKSF